MSGPSIPAIPSKGAPEEQVEGWLADAGLLLSSAAGGGHTAAIPALPKVEVRLLSASDIAAALDSGEIHPGVTGEDLREQVADLDSRVMLLRALAWQGRPDVAVPRAAGWTSRRWPTPKKWRTPIWCAPQAAAGGHQVLGPDAGPSSARRGVADYRIVESGGRHRGGSGPGAAEIIVDITTTATLAAKSPGRSSATA